MKEWAARGGSCRALWAVARTLSVTLSEMEAGVRVGAGGSRESREEASAVVQAGGGQLDHQCGGCGVTGGGIEVL